MTDKPQNPAQGAPEVTASSPIEPNKRTPSPKGKSPERTPAPAQDVSTLLPPEHWQETTGGPPDEFDANSALSENVSSTRSVSSSILKYRTIHGRTFHSEQANAQYWGANDEQQNEAMDINHHVQTLGLGGKLFLAPIGKNPKKVVDIGTGTGIWAIDFADEYPNTEVVGTDISPIQPSWVPQNLQFQIADCTRKWTFPENSIDYVHMRFLSGSIADWEALMKEAYKCLKPGGYIESMEPSACMESDNGTIAEDDAIGQWGKIFVEGGRKMGRSFTVVQDNIQNKAITAAGFVNITEHKYRCPIGCWPKDEKQREIGQFAQLVLEQDYEGIILFTTHIIGGWTREEIHVYIAYLRREIRDTRKHGWFWQKIVWAQKPAE